MGSYGIGPARIAAAAVEQFADEQGISWPRALAPWDVEIVALGKPGTPERDAAEALYDELRARPASTCCSTTATPARARSSPTPSCSACPLRLTVGKRSLESGRAEAQVRRGRVDHEGGVPLQGRGRGGPGAVGEPPVERAPADVPAAVGLDRSGPPPPETLAGAPLNLWTIPNAIGFVRLALIPVFLVVAFSSDDGTDALAGDPLRASSPGATTPTASPRASPASTAASARCWTRSSTACSSSCGVVVCWYFDLLPRWALAVLVARELFMLVAGRYALRRGDRDPDQLVGPAGASGR